MKHTSEVVADDNFKQKCFLYHRTLWKQKLRHQLDRTLHEKIQECFLRDNTVLPCTNESIWFTKQMLSSFPGLTIRNQHWEEPTHTKPNSAAILANKCCDSHVRQTLTWSKCDSLASCRNTYSDQPSRGWKRDKPGIDNLSQSWERTRVPHVS